MCFPEVQEGTEYMWEQTRLATRLKVSSLQQTLESRPSCARTTIRQRVSSHRERGDILYQRIDIPLGQRVVQQLKRWFQQVSATLVWQLDTRVSAACMCGSWLQQLQGGCLQMRKWVLTWPTLLVSSGSPHFKSHGHSMTSSRRQLLQNRW